MKEWFKNILRKLFGIKKSECTCTKCNKIDLKDVVSLTGFKALRKD